MAQWSLYVIRAGNGELYTGISSDVERRVAEHAAGGKKAARYLRGRGPIQLVFSQEIGSRSDALKAEAAVKKLPKNMKESLINGEQPFDSIVIIDPLKLPVEK